MFSSVYHVVDASSSPRPCEEHSSQSGWDIGEEKEKQRRGSLEEMHKREETRRQSYEEVHVKEDKKVEGEEEGVGMGDSLDMHNMLISPGPVRAVTQRSYSGISASATVGEEKEKGREREKKEERERERERESEGAGKDIGLSSSGTANRKSKPVKVQQGEGRKVGFSAEVESPPSTSGKKSSFGKTASGV